MALKTRRTHERSDQHVLGERFGQRHVCTGGFRDLEHVLSERTGNRRNLYCGIPFLDGANRFDPIGAGITRSVTNRSQGLAGMSVTDPRTARRGARHPREEPAPAIFERYNITSPNDFREAALRLDRASSSVS
jgi:hypothetical protein